MEMNCSSNICNNPKAKPHFKVGEVVKAGNKYYIIDYIHYISPLNRYSYHFRKDYDFWERRHGIRLRKVGKIMGWFVRNYIYAMKLVKKR